MKHSTTWRSRYRWTSYQRGDLRLARGGDHCHHAAFRQACDEVLGVIPFVCDHVLTLVTGDQGCRLGAVMALSWGQREPQGVAQSVHTDVNLGAEPTAASAQGLG